MWPTFGGSVYFIWRSLQDADILQIQLGAVFQMLRSKIFFFYCQALHAVYSEGRSPGWNTPNINVF